MYLLDDENWTDRAAAYGVVPSQLSYERYAGSDE